MLSIVRGRIHFVWTLARGSWARIAVPGIGLLGLYDLFISEVLPSPWSENAPKLSWLFSMTGPLLPWWGWTIAVLLIMMIAIFEYAYRQSKEIIRLKDPSSSTLEILYRISVNDDGVERLCLGLRNISDVTVYDAILKASESTFSDFILQYFYHKTSHGFKIATISSISPLAEDWTEMPGYHPDDRNLLNNIGAEESDFTIFASAKDVRTVKRPFHFSKNKRPTVWAD